MIDFIEGEIVAKGLQQLVLKTGAIGYDLKVSNQTLASLPPQGSNVMVYTSLQVREDDISLYGFSSKEERSFFLLVIQVSGVGAKLALAILSAYPVQTLKKALVMGDLAVLTGISGIGKKTAERMVLELKDKINKELQIEGDVIGFDAVPGGNDTDAGQAVEALEALGYARSEIIKAFSGRDLGGMDVEALIKFGLKQLARL